MVWSRSLKKRNPQEKHTAEAVGPSGRCEDLATDEIAIGYGAPKLTSKTAATVWETSSRVIFFQASRTGE